MQIVSFFSFLLFFLFSFLCHSKHCLLITAMSNVIFILCFKLKKKLDWDVCDILYAFFDVRNLIFGYLIYVFEMCMIRWAIYTYHWMCVLVIVKGKIVSVHQLVKSTLNNTLKRIIRWICQFHCVLSSLPFIK